MEDKNNIIYRDQLYQEVWQIPMQKLAKKYGISDRGLSKICDKLKVPRPIMGYWVKLEHGKKVDRIPLPKVAEKFPTKYKLMVHRDIKPKEEIIPELEEIYEYENDPRNKIKVCKTLSTPHELTLAIKDLIDKRSVDKYGRVNIKNVIKVTPKLANRALRILDALYKGASKRNYLEWKRIDRGFKINFNIFHAVRFELTEPTKQKFIGYSDSKYFPTKQYEYLPTGNLNLEVSYWSAANGIKRTWKESDKFNLEDTLNIIMAGFAKLSYYRQQEIIEMEKERAESKRLEEIRNREEKKIKMLLDQSNIFDEMLKVKNYVDAVEHHINNTPNNEIEKTKIEDWIHWARQYIFRIDPIQNRSFLEQINS